MLQAIHMVKPMLAYKSLNARAMENLNKRNLPVYWAPLSGTEASWKFGDLWRSFVAHVGSVLNFMKSLFFFFSALAHGLCAAKQWPLYHAAELSVYPFE
ncbi:hypothetical protein CEXT_19261 [Caerostris extrusa]|uniref:Uncharacterized protein n=1 Tax=Caerostris extrusa TaxID=172846 RepID=A0AAV4XCT4_CAEEX|nr:hypothetical protein CEXT_19261 [Caerostris extrusa]